MTSLRQMVRIVWPVRSERGTQSRIAWNEKLQAPTINSADVRKCCPQVHPGERLVRYRTLIELRQVLLGLAEPARTTVVLVLGEQLSAHLPTLLSRDTFAFRLVLTSPGKKLLGTLSPGDLALRAPGWGWGAITYERDLPQAIAAARESMAADEPLLILWPDWLP